MSSSKGKKKKWSKGKVKEKSNMMVLFDKNTFEKLNNEVPKYKMITPSILVDRLRVRITKTTTPSPIMVLLRARHHYHQKSRMMMMMCVCTVQQLTCHMCIHS